LAESKLMVEHPVYLRIPTENELPLFASASSAEVVISAVIRAQQSGWLTLHGFVVLPETLELVATPLKVSVSALVGYIESETIPLLHILLPNTDLIWNRHFMRSPLETQRSLDARLHILLLSPVARGLAESADAYAYSSVNPRYSETTTVFTGFRKTQTAPLVSFQDDPDETIPTNPPKSASASSDS
jgi:hypothetical protein